MSKEITGLSNLYDDLFASFSLESELDYTYLVHINSSEYEGSSFRVNSKTLIPLEDIKQGLLIRNKENKKEILNLLLLKEKEDIHLQGEHIEIIQVPISSFAMIDISSFEIINN